MATYGVLESRVHTRNGPEEQPIVGHGEEDARRAEKVGVECAEGRNRYEHRHERRTGRTDDGGHGVRGDERRLRDCGSGEDVDIAHVHEHVGEDDRQRAADDRARKRVVRPDHFAASERNVAESIVRPQDADQREPEAARCHRCRCREVRGRGAVTASQEQRYAGERHQCHELGAARCVDDDGADPGADNVGRRGNDDGGGRDQFREQMVRRRIDTEHAQRVVAARERDSADRGRSKEHELGPSEEERHGTAPAFAQIRVVAARLGEGGRQFGQRQRAGQRQQPADDPQPEKYRRIAHPLSDPGRRTKDARADCDADDQRRGAPEAERPRQPVWGRHDGQYRRSPDSELRTQKSEVKTKARVVTCL